MLQEKVITYIVRVHVHDFILRMKIRLSHGLCTKRRWLRQNVSGYPIDQMNSYGHSTPFRPASGYKKKKPDMHGSCRKRSLTIEEAAYHPVIPIAFHSVMLRKLCCGSKSDVNVVAQSTPLPDLRTPHHATFNARRAVSDQLSFVQS